MDGQLSCVETAIQSTRRRKASLECCLGSLSFIMNTEQGVAIFLQELATLTTETGQGIAPDASWAHSCQYLSTLPTFRHGDLF